MSFSDLSKAPPDAILGLVHAFQQDPREQKVNLSAGVYKTHELKPYILETVKQAESNLFQKEKSKDYLPIDGDPTYVRVTKNLVFGPHATDSIYGAQTPGGTAALRVGAEILKTVGMKKIYFSDPTWANHARIFTQAGYEIEKYPYFNRETCQFDFKAFSMFLKELPKHSLVLLQASCHNPTGCDPTPEQWQAIAQIVKERGIFPFFDCAYQGFGTSIEEDVFAIRLFAKMEIPFALSVSHSKNFGLYAERTGALYLTCGSVNEAQTVGSQVKTIIRGLYSNPPCHGARIVGTILSDTYLTEQWGREVSDMRDRITSMRHKLYEQLNAYLPNRFHFLAEQKGMFSYTGLKEEIVDRLQKEFGIYMPRDGRISVAGLNQENVDFIAKAIVTTLR